MPDEIRTRATLLLRLRDKGDNESWAEFAEIYTPLLFGFCHKRGLSHADCADIVQEVMRSISLAMENFEYDPQKGKFKAWLFTAVRHAVGNHLRKRARSPQPAADVELLQALAATPSDPELDEWEADYQRQLLAWALDKIKPEFSPRIWRAFEATALEEQKAAEVAVEIAMSENAVAVAKHRVMKRLKAKVHSVDADRWEDEVLRERRAGGEPRVSPDAESSEGGGG